ncbi:hypothetical protein L1987_72882 [Smallanthus sonchifolius]|uniref:Uncharacterized protein n=1 Tax=Smallanthus sonchifolius TaxID=185202 RepID=A0ACB9AXC0_9ASTR|nr:hypothetical protein L1987_72882 [Smallanthus sonchifolius]
MEQPDEIGVRVYTPSPQLNSGRVPTPPPLPPDPTGGSRRRRAMANGFQKTLSKTSMLINFLPSGTLLTFEMVLPSVYGKGECTGVTTLMINVLLLICTMSCFFFHFTDSFRGVDGKTYYGFATPWGLKVFKSVPQGVEVPKDERYKLGFSDLVHAMMSSMVFLAIAFSDHRVTNCLFPTHGKEMDEVMQSFPLMVGIVCSGLFLVFPNTRFGIGCLSA